MVGLCVLVMAFGLVRGRPVEPMIVAAFSLVVAAVLESLPAVVPLALGLGARWMADRHATVRLSACPPAACGGGAGLGHGDRHRQDRHFDRGRRGCRVAVGTGRVHPQMRPSGSWTSAVEEGRRVYDNVRRFLLYGLAGGVAEIVVMLLVRTSALSDQPAHPRPVRRGTWRGARRPRGGAPSAPTAGGRRAGRRAVAPRPAGVPFL
ncbi:hypothetical protein [Streptomyces sp. CL7]|uniref:hypothetical protein n=1 Tax=Streptomyces sp. CL7 TaxID=3096006 RepID=UPI002A7545F7|nr:hypothetical protein [Streptomyces sp. CL7]WPP34255.1 hypothetical protein SJH97_33065 [Streptomyces sp. CL7]